MSALPPGFTLDGDAQQRSGLPAGFALDAPGFDRSRFDMTRASGTFGVGRGEALAGGLAQGATVGLADEAASAIAASPLAGAQERNRYVPSPFDLVAGAGRLIAERVSPQTFGGEGTQAAQDRFAKEQLRNDMMAYERPVETIAGNIAGGIALPLPAVQGVRSGAAVGAGMGAAYGFGTGTDLRDRAEQAATGGLVGGALGGALGGVASALQRPAQPTGGVTAQGAAEAAGRLGVDIPKFIATDSMATQRTAQGLRNVPFAGDPIVRGAQRFNEQLGQAADNVVSGMGSGERATAGQAASTGIRDWITGRSRDAVTKAYDAVDNVVNPNVAGDLAQTRTVVSDILARRQNAQIAGDSRAVNEVIDAVQSRGLNYQGIKDLRTSIGEKLNAGILPEGMSPAEMKRIYGALTDDMRNIVQQAGGSRGLALWERANRYNATVSARREELAKIVGKDGSAAPEMVFDRILALASDKGGGNVQRLAQARKAIGQDDWREVGSAIVARMGRDAQDEFSPNRFVTAWGKMSDQGKAVLFPDKAHRAALDDLFTLSVKGGPAQARFANPSGTAQGVGFMGMMGGASISLPHTLGTVIGGRMLANALAQPATASSMAKMARAYSVAVERPTAATYAALQSAARNFASTAGDKIGLTMGWQDILRGMVSGPRVSPAVQQPEGQNQQGEGQ